jgi:hypothetical protein
MVSRIMGNRRIPRKIKKALKYAFLYPRVCGRYLRYGAVYTVGRNSKWTRKAAKIRRQMDYAEMINMMTQRVLIIVLRQKLYLKMEDFRQNICLQVREV